jgi:hypothetical protein
MDVLHDVNTIPTTAALRGLRDRVRDSLTKGLHERADDSPHILLVLDDISFLNWIDLSTLECIRFVRAFCALAREARRPNPWVDYAALTPRFRRAQLSSSVTASLHPTSQTNYLATSFSSPPITSMFGRS